MVILVQLELNNFKTFIGSHVIKITKKFTVVTGPNGAGKSNFMDAIAFAMGAGPKALRVSKIEELIHTSVPVSRGMFVQAVLQAEDGSHNCFKRSVIGINRRCYINDNEVQFHTYQEELIKLNINSNVNNFLVFQDSVETIIMQKPIDRSKMFEEISGSIVLKPEYDRLKEQLSQHRTEHQALMSAKRSLVKDIRAMQFYQLQAKKYHQLSKQHEAAQLRLLLFNLYHVRRATESWIAEKQKLKGTINELSNTKYDKEVKLGRMLETCDTLASVCAEKEEICRSRELEVQRMADALAEIRATKEYLEKRVAVCTKSYASAVRADAARQSAVRELENAYKVVQGEKDKYIKQYSKTLGRDINLSHSQMKEYEKLKLLLCAACASDNQRLFPLDHQYKILKDIYESEATKLNEVSIAIHRKRVHRDAIAARIEKLENAVKNTKADLNAKRESYGQLIATFEYSTREEQRLRNEIDRINEELSDIEDDGISSTRTQEDVLERLKIAFPGVYKRLGDLCQPIHDRYSIAVTKVLGWTANAIVVDEAKTARRCIEYLKENRISVCTFLPLDQLRQVKLSVYLRDIRHPPNVKLIYDIIKFAPPEVATAVFYATQNTLVCETAEDASQLANQSSKGLNCVSLDGCYYHASGVMSGGQWYLARQAARWNSQKQALKERKKNLLMGLKELLKSMPKQSDLSLLAMTIKNIEVYSQYPVEDRINAYKELNTVEDELKVLEEEKQVMEARATETKSNMDKAFEAKRELQSKLDAKETEIFANFCARIKVRNIQEYESGKESYEKRIYEFEQQINRIMNQLSYERDRDTQVNVKRWKKNLNEMKCELDSIVERENNVNASLEEATRKLETAQGEYRNSSNLLKEMEKQIQQLKNEIATMARKHKSLTKACNVIQHGIDKKRAEFHALLIEAKVSGLLTVENGEEPSLSQISDTSSSNSLSETYELEARVKIDFSNLPTELRHLEGDEIEKTRETLEDIITDQWKEIDAITDPDMRASQHLTVLEENLSETNSKLEANRDAVKNTRTAFDRVKEDRSDKFLQFFDQVSHRVDIIYKQFTGNQAAQAYLLAENPEEPYLAGIQYDCVVPGKRFQLNDNLSGGEKTMAALPLLFATQSVDGKHVPFEIVDEIDAALDHSNALKVANYMKHEKENQSIVISHKKEFIAKANVIIGITSKRTCSCMESKTFTFDLSPYREHITR